LAAQRGDVALAARAIESGVDVNGADHAGWTPLHEASASGQYTVVEMLISNGADVNRLSSDNISPLHDAIQCGDARLVWLLLRHGALVDEGARTMAKSGEIHRLLNMETAPIEYSPEKAESKQHEAPGEGSSIVIWLRIAIADLESASPAFAFETEAEEEDGDAARDSREPSSQLDSAQPESSNSRYAHCPLEEESNTEEGALRREDAGAGDVYNFRTSHESTNPDADTPQPETIAFEDGLDSVDSPGTAVESAPEAETLRNSLPEGQGQAKTKRIKTAALAKELLAASKRLQMDKSGSGATRGVGSAMGKNTLPQKVPPLRILIPRSSGDDPNTSPSTLSRHSAASDSPLDKSGIAGPKLRPNVPAGDVNETTQILTRFLIISTKQSAREDRDILNYFL